MKPHSVLMRRARGYRSQHATAFIAPTHHHTFMMPSTPSLQKKSGVSCMSIRSRDFSSKSHPAFMSMASINAPSDPSQRSTLDSLSNEEKTIYQELALLSERIRILDSAYYGRESHDVKDLNVTDEEYDALARKEAELCIAYPHLLALLETETGLGSKATRYGGRVGQLYSETESSAESKQNAKPKKKSRSPTKKRIKRQHLANEPMLSLDNAMEEVEAVAWLNRVRKLLLAARQDHIIDEESDVIEFPITISAEPKIDGLSLSLRYELKKDDLIGTTFKFAWASTRGDGTQGEDVTDAVKSAWMGNKTQDETGHYFVPDTIAIQSGDESTPSVIEIRGEVVLPQESFDEFMDTVSKDANATLFSNARNAASGILLRSKEPVSDEELERTRWLQSRLRFYAYDVAPSSVADQIVGTNMQDMRKILLGYGFDVPNPIINETVTISSSNKLNSSDMTNLFTYHHNVMESRDESSLDMERPSYQIDGVVYKLSDFKDRQICGSSSRTPRWAIAHKFPPLSAITRLHKIDVQVGRTGALTPVAILEPVDLGGVLVSRASLHNFHYAKKLLLPKMEDSGHLTTCVRSGVSVLVSRAGDVIPQIIKRVYVDANEEEIDTLRNDDNYTMLSLDPPTNCPACGSPTTFEHVSSTLKQKRRKKENSIAVLDEVLQPTEVDGNITGQVLRCSGPQLLCQPRAVNALAYAYSRSGLDVKGLSKSKLQQLIDNNIIRFPADLFLAFGNTNATKQEEMLQKIAELPGWGTLSSENLADSIRAVTSKGISLPRFIYSLGIPFIGTQASQLIASSYRNVDDFLGALDDASNFDESNIADGGLRPFVALTGDDESDKVKGIGPVALDSLLAFSKEENLVVSAKDLAKAIKVYDDDAMQYIYENERDSPFKGMSIVFTGSLPIARTEAQNAVKALGAKSTPNTINKSTDIVVVGDKGGKKAKQAEGMGVTVIYADEFLQLIGK